MDDFTLCERLNQLGRLAQAHVAAGTPDTGKSEITQQEADRILRNVMEQGASKEQLRGVLSGDGVLLEYRAALFSALLAA